MTFVNTRSQRSLDSERKFLARLVELGASLAPGARYEGANTSVSLLCNQGHPCSPTPHNMQSGYGICLVCANRDPVTAKAATMSRIAALGAQLAPNAVYRGADVPIHLICANGHDCHPRPAVMQQGKQGICLTCAGNDMRVARAAFMARIAELGATLAPGVTYINGREPISLICVNGHACAPRPSGVLSGRGICRTCVNQDPATAEAAFWINVAKIGATPVLGSGYVNSTTSVSLTCAQGHSCSPRPGSLQAGQGICHICWRADPSGWPRFVAAKAAFLGRVIESGARLAPGAAYRGKGVPVQLICARGHRCNPRPNSLQQGQGICHQCAVMFNRVYLLQHPVGALKVGVASGEGRVTGHGRRGYRLVAEWQNLDHMQAATIERECIAWWRSQGWAQIDTAPKDGRTETTASEHLTETLAWLDALIEN